MVWKESDRFQTIYIWTLSQSGQLRYGERLQRLKF